MRSAELGNLVRIGQLKREPPSTRELAGLLTSGERRLADVQRTALAFDSRFDLGYNAAHALALYLAHLEVRERRPHRRAVPDQRDRLLPALHRGIRDRGLGRPRQLR